MSLETARRALNLFMYLSEGVTSIEFIFTGGEPLLEFAVLRDVVLEASNRVHEVGIQAEFVIKTNGTILTAEIITFLKTLDVKVVVSIDGDGSIHDRKRKARGGRPTHEAVVGNLIRLMENKIRCVASITVDPGLTNALPKGVQFLHALGIQEIDIGPAYGTVSWSDGTSGSFVTSLMKVADYMRRQNRSGNCLEVGPLFRDSEHVNRNLLDHWGCHAGASHLAFLPDGKIAGCSALAMISARYSDLLLGDVTHGLDSVAVDRMLKLSQACQAERGRCSTCDTAANCTGGCLAINYSTTGTPLQSPPIYCKTIASIPEGHRRAWGAGSAEVAGST